MTVPNVFEHIEKEGVRNDSVAFFLSSRGTVTRTQDPLVPNQMR